MNPRSRQIVEYRRYELPVAFPVLLLEGDYWTISTVRNKRLHFHNCFEIGLCHSLDGTLVLEQGDVPFHSGDMTFLPPYLPHTTYSGPAGKSLWTYLFFDIQLLSFFADPLPGLDIPALLQAEVQVLSREQEPVLYQLVCQLMQEARGKTPLSQETFSALLYSLLLLLQRKESPALAARETKRPILSIAPALRYLQTHYADAISVAFLAELCHSSQAHFSRTFLEIMGDTPWNYVNTVRIEKACTLLQSTDLPNLAIAEQVGFQSLSSYNQYFRRIMHQTPTQFRNAKHRDNLPPTKKSVLEYKGWTRPEELSEEESDKKS